MDPAQQVPGNGTGADTAMQLASYLPYYYAVDKVINSSRTFLAVMTGVVVFNHLSTFPREVQYVWKAPVTFLNVCLMICRYGIIVELAVILYLFYWPSGSVEDCKRVYLIEAYLPTAVLFFTNILLVVRVYALWGKNKAILGLMLATLLAMVVIQIWVAIKSEPMQMPTGIPALGLPDIRACVPGTSTDKYWLGSAMSAIFDLQAFVLSIVPVARLWMRGSRSPIVSTLYRDGVFMFAICFAATLANIIYSVVSGPNDNKAYLGSLATGFQSICASNMIFNARSANAGTSSVSIISAFRGRGSKSDGSGGHRASGGTGSAAHSSSKRRSDMFNGSLSLPSSAKVKPSFTGESFALSPSSVGPRVPERDFRVSSWSAGAFDQEDARQANVLDQSEKGEMMHSDKEEKKDKERDRARTDSYIAGFAM